MHKKQLIITFLFYTTFMLGQLNPQSKKITEKFFPDAEFIEEITPALQKKKGYTDYD